MKVEEVAAAICSHLDKRGMSGTLSGGSCVTIYSDNVYKSGDLDFVMSEYDMAKLDSALSELGFERTSNLRHYENPDCQLWVEFPPAPLSVGEEVINKTNFIKTKYGKLRLLRVIDCVKDRLAAFYHWGDRQSLEQAVMVASNNKIFLKEIERWSEGEGSLDKFEIFMGLLKEN